MTIATAANELLYPDDPPDIDESLFRSSNTFEEIERFARLGRFYLDTAMRRYDQMIKLMKEGRDSLGPH